MSKVKTLTQLNDVMTGDFAWRKRELTNVKWLVSTNDRSHLKSLYVRGAIALLYAHWEGFVKRVGVHILSLLLAKTCCMRNSRTAFYL